MGVALLALVCAGEARAVADGVPLSPMATESVFGSAVAVGNTLMEHDGQVNFALRIGGSDATIDLSDMPADASVVRAFLFWAGTHDNIGGSDGTLDFELPDGTFFNNLSISAAQPGETLSPLNRCVTRNHNILGIPVPMFSCRREVTALLQPLGAGGAVGTYHVEDVSASPGDCGADPTTCQAKFAGWALAVMWSAPDEPVRRDLVLSDAFFAVDEQGTGMGFSSGISPQFSIGGFTIGPTADGELSFMAFEGDAQLGVPPQNLQPPPTGCPNGGCRDFIRVRTGLNPVFTDLQDATNRPGNLMNGSNNRAGGVHPGLDLDTFDIGPSGLNVLRSGDTAMTLQAGSGDGAGDNGDGGSGELFLLGFVLMSVETFSPRFSGGTNEKVVLEPVAAPGQTLNYILRVDNTGSANATNTILRDQLPAGVTYQPGSTTNTCGVSSADVGGTSPVLGAGGLNIGTMTTGERCEVRLRVTVNGAVADGTVLSNTFTVSADGLPAVLLGPANTTIEAVDLGQPTKAVIVLGGGAPTPGATLAYTITVPNTGTLAAPAVTVFDVLPPELEALQVLAVPGGATDQSDPALNRLDVRNITVPPGSSVSITFTARIRAATLSGSTIVNQADVDQPSLAVPLSTDDPTINVTAQDPTVVIVSAGVSLLGSSKTATDVDGGLLDPGDVVEFRVRVNKTGLTPTIITLADDLPANVENCQVVGVPAGGALTCIAGGGINGTGQVAGTVNVIGPAVADFVFRVTVSATAPNGFLLQNTARLVPLAEPTFFVDVSSAALTVTALGGLSTSTKIVIDNNGGSPRPNDLLTYTITATNSGNIAVNAIAVTDTVSPLLTVTQVLDGGTQTPGPGGTVLSWLIPTLAPGASAQVRFEARIIPGTPNGTFIDNTALLSPAAPAQPFTTANVRVVVVAGPDLTAAKTVANLSAAPFSPGDTVRYTVTLTNGGDAAATNVVVRDAVDPAFETVILSGGGSVAGSEVVFDAASTPALASIAPGASATVFFDARLLPALQNGLIVSNQARFIADGSAQRLSDDPGTAAVGDATTFTIVSQATLVLRKLFIDADGGAVVPGSLVTVVLELDNSGDAPAANTVVTDTLDPRLTFVSSPDGATAAGQVVSFPPVTASPGILRTLRFTARVAIPLPNGTLIPNQASAASPAAPSVLSDNPGTAAPTDPTDLLVQSRPVFDNATKAVTDLDGDAIFEPGDLIRYTITVQNTGTEDALTVQVRDVIPAELEDIVPGQGGVVVGGEVVWGLGVVNIGATFVRTLEARVRRPLPDGTIVSNQAFVVAAGIPNTPTDDPSTPALDDPTRFIVVARPFLQIDKTVIDTNGGAVAPGDALQWTMVVRSTGGSASPAVVVSDTVDVNLTNVVALDGGVLAGNVITWNVGALPIDASATLRFTSTVVSPLQNGTVIANQASAVIGAPGGPFLSDDPATAAPLDPTRVHVVSAANLGVSTMESTDAAGAPVTNRRPGDIVRYAIVVTNSGDDAAQSVVVTVPLQNELSFVSAAGGTFSGGPPGGTVAFDSAGVPALLSVAPGDVVTLDITAQVATPLPAGLVISAQASLDAQGLASPFVSDDPSTGAAGDVTSFTVLAVPGITVAKDVFGSRVRAPGDVVDWTLVVRSSGTGPSGGGVLSDLLPPGLIDVVAGPGLSFDAGTNTLTGAVAPLAPNATATFTFSTRIDPSVTSGSTIENQAGYLGADVGAVPSDDPATLATPVDPTLITIDANPILATSSKTFTDENGGLVSPGDTVRFVITVINSGNGVARDVRVADDVDARFEVISVEDGGAQAGNAIVWDGAGTPALAAVPRNSSVEVAFTARVRTTVPDGTTLTNQASITSLDLPGPALTDDPSTAAPGDPTALVVRAPVLTFTKALVDVDGAPLEPGDAVEYRLTIANSGSVSLTNAVVSDVLPGALTNAVVLDGGTLNAGVASFTLTTLGPNATVVLRIQGTVNPLAAGGTVVSNQADLMADQVSPGRGSDDPATAAPNDPTRATVVASEVYTGTVEVFDGDTGAPIATPVIPGQRVRARITFVNSGTQVAQAVVLRAPFQIDRLRIDETTNGGIIVGAGNDRVVEWSASQDASFTQIGPGETRVVEMEGAIASPIPDGIDIPVLGLVTSSTAPVPTTIGPAVLRTLSRATLSASTKEVLDLDGGSVEPGDTLRYRITVLNDGGLPATGVVAFDPVPGATNYLPGTTRLRGQPVADVDGAPPTQAGLAIGELLAGQAVVIEFDVRVILEAPRGLRIDNQAVLRADGLPDTASDNPATPLITGDATSVIVGGGPSLVVQKTAAPVPAQGGQPLRFDVHVENVGTEPATDVRIEDAVPAGTTYRTGSLRVDGTVATDSADRDEAELAGTDVVAHRTTLEAGEGMTLSFEVVIDLGTASVSNQARVTSNAGTTLSDGDLSIPGAQPTLVPVAGQRALLFDPGTAALRDDDGGVLLAGDAVTVTASIRNRSIEVARIDALALSLSNTVDVDPATITDPRFVFAAAARTLGLAANTTIELAPGASLDLRLAARVREDVRTGEAVRVVGSAHAVALDGAVQVDVDLGRHELTVGLVPGAAAIEGTLFLEGGERNARFDPRTDVGVRGFSVLAFWRDDDEPVQTAITDAEGRYRLVNVPAGRYRFELVSPSGASFGSVTEDVIADGEVRERDVALIATGSVYRTDGAQPATGVRVFLFEDDGDADPLDDRPVAATRLGAGQQGQTVSAQGLYRFDAPRGRFRIGVVPPDPLLAFPSSAVPVQAAQNGNPLGGVVEPDELGDMSAVALVQEGKEPFYTLRFEAAPNVPLLQRNHVPVDALKAQLSVTKTANRKRVSVGDIVSYAVRIDNRALAGVPMSAGGVEIVDTLPAGLRLVDGSFRLDRIDTDAKQQQKRSEVRVRQRGTRAMVFGPFELRGGASYELRYNVVIGPGTPTGEHENTAAVRLADGQVPLSSRVGARVQVVPDAVFDLGTVRAKVFCDDDNDGWQDAGELGLPGTRMYIDVGAYADADPEGRAHFTALPPGMHLVKIDERTLPPGTTVPAPRQSFYLSAGLPAQVSFAARCAFVAQSSVKLTLNEDAYRPDGAAGPRQVAVRGTVSPPRVVVDGTALEVATVDLGVALDGDDPRFGSAPGPNVPRLTSEGALAPRLVFVPKVDGPAAVAWQLTVRAADAPVDSPAAWIFAGRGAPPDRLVFDGRDPASGAPVLLSGRAYHAVLSVGFDGGDRASSLPRPFGVRYGASTEAAAPQELGQIDESGGALFGKNRRPTRRLLAWLGERAPTLKAGQGPIIVAVHVDAGSADATGLTTERAAAVAEALTHYGIDKARVSAVGAGDHEQKVPNLRKKDRPKNRRVVLTLQGTTEKLPLVPPPVASPMTLRVQGVEVTPNATGAFEATATVPAGGAFLIEAAGAAGAVRVLRPIGDGPVAAAVGTRQAASADVGVSWAPGGPLSVDGVDRDLGPLLGARVRTGEQAADGRLRLAPEGQTRVLLDAPGLAVTSWTLRVLEEIDAPGAGDFDARAGVALWELSGDGALPPEVTWDGNGTDGQRVATDGRGLRLRLIARTEGGDTAISPDARALVGAAVWAPRAVLADGTDNGAPTLLSDAFEPSGALRPAAKAALEAQARDAGAGATVQITVHTDDAGPRMLRSGRSQRVADEVKQLFVAAGVPADQVTAQGKGSDAPLAPNAGKKNRARNRRIEVAIAAPSAPAAAASQGPVTPPALRANGKVLTQDDGAFRGAAPALQTGDVVLDVRDGSGARASVRVRRGGDVVAWQGDGSAYEAWIAATLPPKAEATPDAGPAPEKLAQVAPDAGTPAWYPDTAALPASQLVVELPTDLRLASRSLLVRGKTSPDNRVRVGMIDVPVDPLTGQFVTVTQLPEGDSTLAVTATDPMGNVGTFEAPVTVDSRGWFGLFMADTALGQDGALLDERGAYASVTLGDAFLYGRGVGYLKGNFTGPALFRDYDLTLHADTRRWQQDVFDRDVLDPDRFYPLYGDSSLEVVDGSASGLPLYVAMTADASSVQVGSVRTQLQGGDLFRYQRARPGAQLTFDRGWTGPMTFDDRKVGEAIAPLPSPATDPWRTTVTGFAAAGGGQRHARVELIGTGSSVYFLRHERVVEGSERVAIIIRDGITGTEIGRTTLARNLDYTIRYDEGRVLLKEPLGAFADSAFIQNQNLGQVAAGNRIALEVEYEHLDDDPFLGAAGGGYAKQVVLGHVEVGGGYVYEGREDGRLAYQLGGGQLKLFIDEGTFIRAELAGSQSVDAGNFISFDGGLTYQDLGQGLDTKNGRIGQQIYPANRQGFATKVDGQAQLGAFLGRPKTDAVVRAYFQVQQPGFFADANIIEQGQTKWGGEGAWQVWDPGKLRLRYDGVVSQIPSSPPLTEFRTLQRQIASARYEHRIITPVLVAGEYGYGYTHDSGAFGQSAIAQPREFHTNVVAGGVDWQVIEALSLSLKQEGILTGDPNQLDAWNDHLITHGLVKLRATEQLTLMTGASVRWSGENQAHAGVSWGINDTSRVYASERVGFAPQQTTGTMGFTSTSVVGAETELAPGSRGYAEYQLESAFAGQQSRGVAGLASMWRLPFGFALNFGYERIMVLGGIVPPTETGTVPPGAFTDGTFYAAPGANGGGSFLYGEGSRDAFSVGVEFKRGETIVASQRFELRYDNLSEARGGRDRLWFLSGSAAAVKITNELSVLARYNIGLAQDLALAMREAYLEDGVFGVAYRPVSHDWISLLSKLSRRVDVRPLHLEQGSVDDYTAHAVSLEPIVELPWKVQIAEKVAVKHARLVFDDVPEANALTTLWINRLNWHALSTVRSFGIDPIIPGEIDLGVEYRLLYGITSKTLEHGPLIEAQVAPIPYFRLGVGWNFTRFSDQELDRGDVDRSGFFVRAVGTF